MENFIPSLEQLIAGDRTLRSHERQSTHERKLFSRDIARVRKARAGTDSFGVNTLLRRWSHLNCVPPSVLEEIFVIVKERQIQPTVHTFVAAMSVALHMGRNDEALKYFDALRGQVQGKRLRFNVVAYTAAIRAASENGNLRLVADLYEEMKQSHITPNIRTWQTILRLCLHTGHLQLARFIFAEAIQKRNANQGENKSCPSPNEDGMVITSNIVESFTQILCHRFHTKEALHLIETYRSHGTPICYAAVCVTAAIRGESKLVNAMATAFENYRSSSSDKNSKGSNLKNEFHDYMLGPWEHLILKARSYGMNHCDSTQVSFVRDPSVYAHGIRDTSSWDAIGSGRALEIGSGTGDWIIQHLSSRLGTAHNSHTEPFLPSSYQSWACLELRFDRLFHIWAKRTFARIPACHLSLVGGDARESLSFCSSDYFSSIYVNFPEPPSLGEAETYLYNNTFLRTLHRILQPGGRFTFVTDDGKLAFDVASRMKKELSHLWIPCSNYFLWGRPLPESYGCSFFDKFWSNGQQKARYMLCYQKP